MSEYIFIKTRNKTTLENETNSNAIIENIVYLVKNIRGYADLSFTGDRYWY
jgi:spore germination protein YaaH